MRFPGCRLLSCCQRCQHRWRSRRPASRGVITVQELNRPESRELHVGSVEPQHPSGEISPDVTFMCWLSVLRIRIGVSHSLFWLLLVLLSECFCSFKLTFFFFLILTESLFFSLFFNNLDFCFGSSELRWHFAHPLCWWDLANAEQLLVTDFQQYGERH